LFFCVFAGKLAPLKNPMPSIAKAIEDGPEYTSYALIAWRWQTGLVTLIHWGVGFKRKSLGRGTCGRGSFVSALLQASLQPLNYLHSIAYNMGNKSKRLSSAFISSDETGLATLIHGGWDSNEKP
jgi:hypothetical protein